MAGSCSQYCSAGNSKQEFILPENVGVDIAKSGDELIAEERMEQVTKHGKSIIDDMRLWKDGELVQSALAVVAGVLDMMPSIWDRGTCERMIAKTYSQRLVIAGALIAAEIDRVNLLSRIHAANFTEDN